MFNRKNYLVRIIGSFLVVLVASVYNLSYAEDTKGRLAIGFKSGVSIFTQDVDMSGTAWKIGPVVGTNILINLDNSTAIGSDIEWENHKVSFAEYNTISFVPFVQLRDPTLNASPYFKLGVGVNMNSNSKSVAFKVAGGFDYFFNSNIALNSELGWKSNLSKKKFGGDFDASSVLITLGIRYYFGNKIF